jgi:plasmid stabilization system protein ParE
MNVKWSNKAFSDLSRLYEFLETVDPAAAARVVQSLTAAITRLKSRPRIGQMLAQFEPREVRRLIVGRYEIRYEIAEETLYVLRLWHTREDR